MKEDLDKSGGVGAHAGSARRVFVFDGYRIDAADGLLYLGNKRIPLRPKDSEVLLMLVERPGRLVTRSEILEKVWPGLAVEDSNIDVHISALRKALGKEYIETISKRGYCFKAEVMLVTEGAVSPDEEVRSGSVVTTEDEREPAPAVDAADDVLPPSSTSSVTRRTFFVSRKKLAIAIIVCGLILTALVLAARKVWKRQSAVTPAPVKSVAVLPFDPIGLAANDEDLGVLMADAIINKLSNLSQLNVRPTSAVLKYRGQNLDPIKVGRLEQTDAVLEGKIQKVEDKVRVTVQLVRVQDGNALWAGTFDQNLTDVLTLQDLISERIAGALALELSGDDKKRLSRHYAGNTETYRLYIQGRYYSNEYTESGENTAISLYNKAIAVDPNYAPAYAGIADSYWGLSNLYLPPKEAMPKARAAAIRALEIDNALAEAHLSLALVKFRYDWEWAESERSFQRAIELNPSYAFAREQYGLFLASMGRFDEAIAQEQQAHELDPNSTSTLLSLGDVRYYARQYDLSIEQHQKILEIDPNYYLAHFYLGNVYVEKGKLPEAIVEFQKAKQINQVPMIMAGLGYAYAVSGQRRKARSVIGELQTLSKQHWVSPYYIALIYVGLGDKDLALSWLWKAYEERGEEIAFLKVEPKLVSLRSEPKFLDLLQRIKLVN